MYVIERNMGFLEVKDNIFKKDGKVFLKIIIYKNIIQPMNNSLGPKCLTRNMINTTCNHIYYLI